MQPWEQIDELLRRCLVRIGPPRANQTAAGVHAPTSLHYVGRARDYGDRDSDCNAVVDRLLPFARGVRPPICELFYSPRKVFIKNGQPIKPSKDLEQAHRDHVHVGLYAGRSIPLPPPLREAKPLSITSEAVGPFTRITVDIPSLDDKGNGYVQLPVQFKNVVSMFAQGPYPKTDGYWNTPVFGAQQRDGQTIVAITEGPPSGRLVFYVWALA